jgi:SNF2 family DNA or RNA helicase
MKGIANFIRRGSMFRQSSEDEYSSNGEPILAHTPHKKRKRHVQENMTAKATRINDQKRVQDSQKAQTLFLKKLDEEGVSNDDPDHQPVNFKETVIYLHRHIGRFVKPHQLAGIQFMWRELVEDPMRQGCLLAHTMGLGKTMQV